MYLQAYLWAYFQLPQHDIHDEREYEWDEDDEKVWWGCVYVGRWSANNFSWQIKTGREGRDVFSHLFDKAGSSKASQLTPSGYSTATVSAHTDKHVDRQRRKDIYACLHVHTCNYTHIAVRPVCEWRWSSQVDRGGDVKAVCAPSYEPSLPDRLASNRGQSRDEGGVPAPVTAAPDRLNTEGAEYSTHSLSDELRKSFFLFICEMFYLRWCWLAALRMTCTVCSQPLKESNILGILIYLLSYPESSEECGISFNFG